MLNQSQLAELTGMANVTVKKRLKDVTPVPGASGALLYDSAVALPILYGVGAGDGNRLDPSQEKAQLDRERRLIAELDRKQKENLLIPVEDVAKVWTDIMGIAKSNLLAVPSRASMELVNKSDPRQIAETIKLHIHEALSGLSNALAVKASSK